MTVRAVVPTARATGSSATQPKIDHLELSRIKKTTRYVRTQVIGPSASKAASNSHKKHKRRHATETKSENELSESMTNSPGVESKSTIGKEIGI